jgi:Tol biopolymer transport system component
VSDGGARSITSPNGLTYHTAPAFSPDGHHLAYASCLSVYTCQIDVVELGADGAPKGAAQRLTRKAIWMGGGLAWARDGKSLVYSDRFVGGRLCRVKIAGGRPPERIEVAGPAALWPTTALSSDRLAFTRRLHNRDIYRFEMGRPAEVVAASSFEDYSSHFSPDGGRFVFESGRGGEGHEIWLAAADGTRPMQVTHGPGRHQGVAPLVAGRP